MDVCQRESIEYSDDGLEAVVFTAQGDMRQGNFIINGQLFQNGISIFLGLQRSTTSSRRTRDSVLLKPKTSSRCATSHTRSWLRTCSPIAPRESWTMLGNCVSDDNVSTFISVHNLPCIPSGSSGASQPKPQFKDCTFRVVLLDHCVFLALSFLPLIYFLFDFLINVEENERQG